MKFIFRDVFIKTKGNIITTDNQQYLYTASCHLDKYPTLQHLHNIERRSDILTCESSTRLSQGLRIHNIHSKKFERAIDLNMVSLVILQLKRKQDRS